MIRKILISAYFHSSENTPESENAKNINEIMQRLNKITLLRDPQMEYPSYYRQHGFMVRFNAIPESLIRAANISNMKQRLLRSTPHNVFNATDINENTTSESERKQLVTKHYSQILRDPFNAKQKTLLETCEETVVEIIGKLLPNIAKFKTIESVLHSQDKSKERQRPHVDLSDELDEYAALSLIALEPNTTFIMFRSSHKKIGELGADHFPRVYQLGLGDVLIFHPRLIHAGDRYEKSNLRLHYYVIDDTKEYELNLTYTVDLDVSAKVEMSLTNHELCDEALEASRTLKKKQKKNRGAAGLKNIEAWRKSKRDKENNQETKPRKKTKRGFKP